MLTPKRLYSHPFFRQNEVPLEKVSLIACLGSKLCKNDQIPPRNSTKSLSSRRWIMSLCARSRALELLLLEKLWAQTFSSHPDSHDHNQLHSDVQAETVNWDCLLNDYACLTDTQVCLPRDLKGGLRIDLCCSQSSHHTWLKM